MYYVVFNKAEKKQVEQILREGLEVDSLSKDQIYKAKDFNQILSTYNTTNIIVIKATVSDLFNLDRVGSKHLKKYFFDKTMDLNSSDSETSESESSYSSESESSESSESETKAAKWNQNIKEDTLGKKQHGSTFSKSIRNLTINTLDLDARLEQAEQNGLKNKGHGKQ